LEKACAPIDTTVLGIDTAASDVQFWKAPLGISLAPPPTEEKSGSTIDASEVQPSNAYAPMFVTESGIAIDVSDEQPWKAPYPIDVTESGITIDVSVMHLL
jgi:hypothetical protein